MTGSGVDTFDDAAERFLDRMRSYCPFIEPSLRAGTLAFTFSNAWGVEATLQASLAAAAELRSSRLSLPSSRRGLAASVIAFRVQDNPISLKPFLAASEAVKRLYAPVGVTVGRFTPWAMSEAASSAPCPCNVLVLRATHRLDASRFTSTIDGLADQLREAHDDGQAVVVDDEIVAIGGSTLLADVERRLGLCFPSTQ